MPAQPAPRRTDKRRQPVPPAAAPGAPRREIEWDQIARRAYERFEARGGEHGRDQEDWFTAEEELKGARGE